MRRNLYNWNITIFLQALENLGWKETTQNKRSPQRDFTKGRFHINIRQRKLGHYCVIHKNRVRGGHHIKPITKGDELRSVFHEITQEYKRIVTAKTD